MFVNNFYSFIESISVALAAFACLGAVRYSSLLRSSAQTAPRLAIASPLENASTPQSSASVSVIVPAYNEADNVEDCLRSILNSQQNSQPLGEVWLVDDQSSDRTWEIAQSLQQQVDDPRLHLLAGRSRPEGQVWMGKNWACVQAAEQAQGDYLLFLDADVRLKPGSIAAALNYAEQEAIDLLTCVPAIRCGCLAEWLVQPIMFGVISIGYNFTAVNDPNCDVAFAAGPFMLFRRSSYERIGGHRTVGDRVVEDVALAKRIKATGLKLRFLAATELASVQMYRSWGALWEGWTKNLYLGANRNLVKMLQFAGLMLLVCTLPWLLAIAFTVKGFFTGISPLEGAAIALSLAAIALLYNLRLVTATVSGIAPRYWWLTGVGGIAVAAIAIGSIIKTETGWGWTWRGRSLKGGWE